MLFAILLVVNAFAFEAKHKFASYEDAEQATSYLRFDLDTKKMGVFKSHMTGYVREFTGRADIKGDRMRDAELSFLVRDMDTGLYARNDQMWNNCLDAKNHDRIVLRLSEVTLKGPESRGEAEIVVRGKTKKIPLTLTLERTGGKEVVSGKTTLTFRELEVPDPSIGIASVSDEIEVSFRIEGISSERR